RIGALARLDRSAIGSVRSKLREKDFAGIRARIYARAAAAYEPKIRPFAGPVTYFRASDRSCAPGWVVDERGGWADIVKGGLEVVDIPGDHVGILRNPGVELLARKLRSLLGS